MKCPNCNAATRVLETRQGRHGIRRRRECRKCGYRFSTAELALIGTGANLAVTLQGLALDALNAEHEEAKR